MRRSFLFILSGDPRTSPRPAEAIRIAAGLVAGKRIDLSLFLRGASVLTLRELTDEFVDEDHYTRYRPILCESGRPILVQRESLHLRDLGPSALPYRELSDLALAKLASESDYVANF